jgi:fructokinase
MSARVPAIGEVLWDLLPTGKQLGGAPTNFTFHCRSLGATARLVTRIGNDSLGHEVLDLGGTGTPLWFDGNRPDARG